MSDSSPSRRHRLSVPVQVRLSPAVYDRYTEDAERQRVGVSTYLRRRLEAGDQTLDVLEAFIDTLRDIESRLERMEADSSSSNAPNTPSAAEIETLLLLRHLMRISNKKDLEGVQAEMNRLGISPWNWPSKKA